MSPGCLHCRLPFPGTHVMPFVDLGLMMGSYFPSGDQSLSATYNSSEAACVKGAKKKDKHQLKLILYSGNWSLMCEFLCWDSTTQLLGIGIRGNKRLKCEVSPAPAAEGILG